MKVKIKVFDGGKMPEFKTDGAVCADCYARLEKDVTIRKGERKIVPLGFALQLPRHYEAVIRPRSGLSRSGIDIAVGTIDYDYRAEVSACVINNSDEDFDVLDFDRICQMKIQKAQKVRFKKAVSLTDTKRGKNGWGSTGIR